MSLVRVLYVEDRQAPLFQLPGAGAALVEQTRASGGYRVVMEFTTEGTGLAAVQLVERIAYGESEAEVQTRQVLMPTAGRGFVPGDLVEILDQDTQVWLRTQLDWQQLS